jgi:outer membrane protein assembly factor BamB
LEVYDKLVTIQKKRFPNEAAMVQWVNEQNFSEKVKKEILAAVPPTMKVAEDVVICLDLATGKTLWKCNLPGEATGRMASSTPCVADGRVYALGSTNFHAVNACDGKLIWSAKLPGRGPASSPMVVDGILVMNVGKLTAFDAVTGKLLWTQAKAGGGNSSPIAWKTGDKTVVICSGQGVLAGVDLKTGDILWRTPGGGDATPAIVNDTLVVQTSKPDIGILAGKLAVTNFTRLWNIPYDPLRSQSSALILDNCVYLIDDNLHFCFDLNSGRELWKHEISSSSISSPVFADGKIYLLGGGGSKMFMFKPSPEKQVQLGKANVRAMWVPSPAIADGRLLLRGSKGITCYSLTDNAVTAAK